eukprot:1159347-Pelagomonas_calceolata.AAC.1
MRGQAVAQASPHHQGLHISLPASALRATLIAQNKCSAHPHSHSKGAQHAPTLTQLRSATRIHTHTAKKCTGWCPCSPGTGSNGAGAAFRLARPPCKMGRSKPLEGAAEWPLQKMTASWSSQSGARAVVKLCGWRCRGFQGRPPPGPCAQVIV